MMTEYKVGDSVLIKHRVTNKWVNAKIKKIIRNGYTPQMYETVDENYWVTNYSACGITTKAAIKSTVEVAVDELVAI